MPVEVCILISKDGSVLWADRSDDAISLPDARSRWEAIWRHRASLGAVVHSHPVGPLAFSTVDRATMAALDAALGEPQRYAVVSPDGLVWSSDDPERVDADEPWWVELLRWASDMPARTDGRKES